MPGMRIDGPTGLLYGYSENSYWSPATADLFVEFIRQGGTEENFGPWLQACYDLEEGRSVRVGSKRITRIEAINSEIAGTGDSNQEGSSVGT